MKSSATYAAYLFILIASIISGCSSDTDQPQVSHHQYRSQPSNVTLISDDSNYEATLSSFKPYEEKIRTSSKTYSF